MASPIFPRVIRNDEHLHLPLGWHPAVEPPQKGSPLKGDFPNKYQPHKVYMGSIFKGPRNSQGGTTGMVSRFFLGKNTSVSERSWLRSDGVSFAATLAACEKCHWVVM